MKSLWDLSVLFCSFSLLYSIYVNVPICLFYLMDLWVFSYLWIHLHMFFVYISVCHISSNRNAGSKGVGSVFVDTINMFSKIVGWIGFMVTPNILYFLVSLPLCHHFPSSVSRTYGLLLTNGIWQMSFPWLDYAKQQRW